MIEQDYGDNVAIGLPVHDQCCARCPSQPGSKPDPFTLDFMKLERDLRMKTVFPCAWRPSKLCKGYFDLMEKGD